MLPYEINRLVAEKTATPYFTNSCSEEFLRELREFVDEQIARQAAKYREEYGMPPALAPLRRGQNKFGKADGEPSLPSIRFDPRAEYVFRLDQLRCRRS